MTRAVVLVAVVQLIACARSNLGAPPTTCSGDTDCARNQRCVDGGCVACEAPVPRDPCAVGPCYYMAPSGGSDDNAGTAADQAWDTFDHAWATLQPGDTLVLLDGIYTTEMQPRVSGTAAAPITIRAQTDGGAVLDGESVRKPCYVADVSHLNLEGFRCQNLEAAAVNTALLFIGQADHINVRRLTLSEANEESALLSVYNSTDILIEDTAAWGQISSSVFSASGSTRVTFRRCWAEMPTTSSSSVSGVGLYTTSDGGVDNCVVRVPGPVSGYESLAINIGANSGRPADRNQLRGNVVIDFPGWSYRTASSGSRIEGNRMRDNVAVRSRYGTFQRADVDLRIEKQTTVDTEGTCVALGANDGYTYAADFGIHGTVSDSICSAANRGFSASEWGGIPPTLEHDYNVLFAVTTPYASGLTQAAHELVDTVEPLFDTANYGDGAYLIPPAAVATAGTGGGPIGAEVLYRYEATGLSCVPLWPWPMEKRILAERGLSVTWQTDGGIWRTLTGLYP